MCEWEEGVGKIIESPDMQRVFLDELLPVVRQLRDRADPLFAELATSGSSLESFPLDQAGCFIFGPRLGFASQKLFSGFDPTILGDPKLVGPVLGKLLAEPNRHSLKLVSKIIGILARPIPQAVDSQGKFLDRKSTR